MDKRCPYTLNRARTPSPANSESIHSQPSGVYGHVHRRSGISFLRPQSASVTRQAIVTQPPRPQSSKVLRTLMPHPPSASPTPPRPIKPFGAKVFPTDTELGIQEDDSVRTTPHDAELPEQVGSAAGDSLTQVSWTSPSATAPVDRPAPADRPVTPTPVSPIPSTGLTIRPVSLVSSPIYDNPVAVMLSSDTRSGDSVGNLSKEGGSGEHNSGTLLDSNALKTLREAGSAVVAVARIQRIQPDVTIESLAARGINVNNLSKILDRFVRFTLLVRGRMMQRALRKNRPAQNPSVEWELFIQGSEEITASHTFSDSPFVNDVKGLGMRRVDFTPSHIHFRGWERDQAAVRSYAYREVSGVDCSPSQNGHLVMNFKLWSTAPTRVRFAAADAPSLIGILVQRMAHNFFKGSAIVGGLMKKSIRIIHFNDVYHLTPFKNPDGQGIIGGASRFLTKVREIQKYHNPLILFSGDFMSPSLMSVLMKGKHMIDAFNLIGVHFGTFGNHEFDYGMKALTDCIHGTTKGNFVFTGSNTQWVVSNMTDAEGAPLGGAISKSLVVWNGVRVGILGLSENWLPQCGQLKKEDWVYHDSEEVGERMAQELKRVDGAEVVIALCHNRFSKDIELSEKCPSIDLILGGHDHFYKNAPKYRTIKSGEEFEYLTEIELFIDQTSHQVKYRSTAHTITRDIPPHPAMETVIARFDKRLRSRMGKVIGTSSVPLDLTEACCRFKEGLVPGFIVDVMAMRSKADFAILGGAAISGKSIKPPGDITVGDIFSWFPNDTKIMTVRIKGRTVQKMLDVMVREVPNEAPSFPHPSSALNFTINTMRSPTVVQDIYVRGKPIEMDADYVVAVEDFVGLGKAKYKFIPVEGETLCDDEAAEQITYWIIDYFDCDDNRSEKADKKLSLLTNIAMRDTVFGLTDIRGKLTAGMAASTSQLLHESTRALSSSATSDIFARSIGRNDPGIAASVLAEARKLSQYQRSQLETVYFELEASLKRLVPCGQVRVFHFMENSGKAWFRGNNQQPRRIVVDNCGAFGSFYGAKTTKVLTGSIPYDGPFDIQAEGEHDVENRNFISIPIIFNKQALCSITLVNRQGGEFTDNDCDAVALLITQAQPIVAFAVAVQTKEAEEERIRTLITLAGDIVQSNDNTTVNDTLAKVTDHAKSIFGVEKASFYVFDKPKNELWTVRKSVNTQRQIEFVSKRKSATGAGILTTAIQMKGLARYSDSEATLIPNLDRMYERNALALPIWSRKEKDSLCGVLLIADKINGGFTQTDERLMGYLAPFIAIAIDTTTELEVLRTGVDRTRLRTFPVHELTRIRFKRGWGSVRSRVSYIASDRFKDKEARIAAGRSISDEAPSVVAILQTSEATALLV